MIKKIQTKLGKDVNLKELLSGSALTFIIKVTGILFGYLVVWVISRKYGADGVGLYSLTSRLLNSLAILGCLGLNISVLRYVGQYGKHPDAPERLKQLYGHAVKLAFPFAVLLGALLYFFAQELAVKLFENETYIPALKISAVALPFFAINLINIEFIRGLKRLKVSEYLRSINRPMIILVLLLFSIFGFGILNPVYAYIAALGFTFILSQGYILGYLKKAKSEISIEKGLRLKEVWNTSSPMMTKALASFVLTNAGSVFLEIYAATDQVGIFNVALRLAQLVSLILIVVNTISAPKFAELYWAGKTRELQKIIRQTTKLIFWTSLAMSILLVLFSKFFLGIFGTEFKTGSLAMIMLVIAQMVNASTGSVGVFLNMSGNQKAFRNIMLVTMVLTLAGYYFFTPLFGVFGTACVALFGALIVNISSAVYAQRKLNIITYFQPFK